MHYFDPLEPRRLFASTLSISSPTASESDKSVTFHVSLSAPSPKPVTLTYATQPLTAAAGRDFKPTTGRLTLPAGSTSADIKIPLINDNRIESTETFRLSLRADAKLAKPFATATITDDEARPTFSITSSSVTEGTGKTDRRTATLTVSLGNPFAGGTAKLPPSDVPFTVRYDTADLTGHFGTAAPKADYTPAHGTLTFRPGQTKQTIQIPVLPDNLTEGTELVTVALSHPTGGTLAPAAPGLPVIPNSVGTVTITDDDTTPSALPTLHIPLVEDYLLGSGVFLLDASNPGPSFTFTVHLPAPTNHDVTFDLTYPVPATPAGYSDTEAYTIPAGQTDLRVTVYPPLDLPTKAADGTYKESSFSIRLSHLTGATLPGSAPSLIYTFGIAYHDIPIFHFGDDVIRSTLGGNAN